MRRGLVVTIRALTLAASVASLAGCAGLTYGTGVATSTQTIRDVVGIADMTPDARDPINYQARAGLVTPPSASLPPPVDPTTTALADFPQDEPGPQFVSRPVFAGGAARGGAVDAAGQPVRQYLTEPPTEYRTPAPDAPMAIAPTPPEQRRRFDIRSLWPF